MTKLLEEILDMTSALDTQVGGNHYKNMAIQPIEYIMANKLDYCEANVVKYISRWRNKGGVEDLRKVKHYVDLLIDAASDSLDQLLQPPKQRRDPTLDEDALDKLDSHKHTETIDKDGNI